MIIAKYESSYFSFTALETTEKKAFRVLSKAWRNHCKQYQVQDFEKLDIDNVNFLEIEIGQGARDYEIIYKRKTTND